MPKLQIETYRFNYDTRMNEPPPQIEVDVFFFPEVDDLHNRRWNKAFKVVPTQKISIPGEITVPMPPVSRSFVFVGTLPNGIKSELATPLIYGNDGQKVTLYFPPVERVEPTPPTEQPQP